MDLSLFQKNTLMFPTAKLPRFMEHLFLHYRNLYTIYSGRLVELFPCFDGSVNNLAIAEDKKTSEEEDNFLFKLWRQFQ